ATDQALDRKQGVVRVGNGLALCALADEDLLVFGEGDDGRRGAITFRVLDNLGLSALLDRNAGVGCAEVDADDSAHVSNLPDLIYCVSPTARRPCRRRPVGTLCSLRPPHEGGP